MANEETIKDRQGFQPGEAGLVEKWDPIKGRFRTMQEMAEEREWTEMILEAAARNGRELLEARRRRALERLASPEE